MSSLEPMREERLLLRFVRGTLLLSSLTAEWTAPNGVGPTQVAMPRPADSAPLPGFVWDARVGAWRAPGWRYPEVRAALDRMSLAQAGQPPVVDEVRDRLRTALPTVAGTGWTEPSLRPYQDASLDAWGLNGRRGVVALPTGSGKTRTAIAAMARLEVPALCLVPTRVLLHQWRSELRKHYDGPIGVWGDGEHATERICVATFESGYRHLDRHGADFGLLVVDEVHHFGQGARDETLEMAVAPARLGLTATPPHDAVALGRLEALVGPTVYELRVGDLAGTFLADFDLVVMRLAFDATEREAYDRDVERFRRALARYYQRRAGGSWEGFVADASRSDEGRAALVAWRAARRRCAFHRAKARAVSQLLARHRDARVLVFTADNASAYEIARTELVMPITCDIARAERDEALEAFRRGEIRALVSSRVLNEGLDVPDADVAIVVGASAGVRELVQRIGRLLRPAPNKRATVYELVTAGTTEPRKARARRRSLGHDWREVA
jgi:superfamily II DNA or RNA helicase